MKRLTHFTVCSALWLATVPVLTQGLLQREVVLQADQAKAVAVTRNIAYKPEAAGAVMDIYAPSQPGRSAPLPAVIFVHGGPVPATWSPIKDIGQYRSYGRLVASRGLVAVTFDHRFTELAKLDIATADVADAVAFVRAHATDYNIDRDRLSLWVVSGAGVVVAPILRREAPYLRCLLFYYTVADISGFGMTVPAGLNLLEYSVIDAIRSRGVHLPPMLVARAGKDSPAINRSLDGLVAAALEAGVAVDVYAHPTGPHAFDILDDSPRSRDILEHSLAFVRRHLLGTTNP